MKTNKILAAVNGTVALVVNTFVCVSLTGLVLFYGTGRPSLLGAILVIGGIAVWTGFLLLVSVFVARYSNAEIVSLVFIILAIAFIVAMMRNDGDAAELLKIVALGEALPGILLMATY